MSNNSSVLVPIHMEALVLKKDKEDCLDLRPNFNNTGGVFLQDELQPKIKNKTRLEKGIHLHWSLPKALRHSFVTNKTNETRFPIAPNRWMITRIRTDKGVKNMPSRIWIIESDAINSNNTPNWLLVKDNKLDFKNIGKKTEWDAGFNESSSEVTVSAVGVGNPFFSSFYHSCKNIFGFHDDLKDLDDVINSKEKCTLTYVVTGWYSDNNEDPLGNIPDTTSSNITENEYIERKRIKEEREWIRKQWAIKQDDDQSIKSKNNIPDFPSIYHSSIQSIRWDNKIKTAIPKGDIQVYAGNSSVESLSAQIARTFNFNKPEDEELISALQYQLLEDYYTYPDWERIKSENHKRGFSPRNRGITWEISKQDTREPSLDNTKKQSQNSLQDEPTILENLKRLNHKQIQYNSLKEELESLHHQYYCLWYKEACTFIYELDFQKIDYEDLKIKITNKIKQKTDEINSKPDGIKKEISDLVKSIKNKIDESNKKSDIKLELKEKLEDRFWEPNEPVLLLCGQGIRNTEIQHFQSADLKINYRNKSQVLDKLSLNMPTSSNEAPELVEILKTSFTILQLDTLKGKVPVEEIKALVYETVLLDHSLSVDISKIAYEMVTPGGQIDKDSATVKEFAQQIINIQSQLLLENPHIDYKSPASFSVRKWQQAWVPLFMAWEVKYTHNVSEIRDIGLLKDSYSRKPEDSFLFEKETDANNTSITIEGISPFSNSVLSNLKETLPDEITANYDQENVIAQSLSGLHKSLLMQKTGIQLPPIQYRSNSNEYKIDLEEMRRMGENGYSIGCDPGDIEDGNLFYPLRGGTIEITKLSIVDAFGQEKKVILKDSNTTKIICSRSLKDTEKPSDNFIPLPARILQPARLQCNWLSVNNDPIYQEGEKSHNPVLGWLIPNYLDNSIMIYDRDGDGVDILHVDKNSTKEKLLNLELPPFIKNLSEDDTVLQKMLSTIQEHISGINQLADKVYSNLTDVAEIKNNTSALIYGQPIAVACCSISLELLGLPANNQRWDQSEKENNGGITSQEFPLYVGNYNIENDGLLGYFINDEYSTFYTTPNIKGFNHQKKGSFFKKSKPLKLSIDKEIKLTLLMDPTAGVHLATDILPTKCIQLSSYHVEQLLSKIDISFMIAPFIGNKTAPGIPLPISINADWKWCNKKDINTLQNDEEIVQKRHIDPRFAPKQAYEGWIRLSNIKTKI
ncbi:hypothetical protein ATE84_2613 [Aquimarina sp. MAR_2010_214]|uniref:hypothetical protein n=1 Tax=Aquimarina sp. MAR_2010_214 TaxID=1250026 RepID=UPI000C7039D1|nr:hypothetical protein [Aquimarina sp. MAR_2010_214]PKV50554.1 hypothetical protein ATE84_2613 [Aquimarina sp. MAR_2010_214]